MQIQFDKSELRCLETVLQEVQNTEVTQELRLPEGMPDIGRILTTRGQILIRSKEWHGTGILLSGGIKAWTLYAPEDGTEPRSVESWIPFQFSWKTDPVEQEGQVRMLPLLRFLDSRSISSRKMILRAGVAALAQGLCPKETELFAPQELPEDIQILKKTHTLEIPAECGEKTFLVDDELALPDATAEKLMSVTVRPEISENRMLPDKLVIRGELMVHLLCRNPEGEIEGHDLSVPFSQLAELGKSYASGAQADLMTMVTGMEADLEENRIRLKCSLAVQYLVCESVEIEVVQDSYSPERQVMPTQEMLRLPVILERRMEERNAELTLTGHNGNCSDLALLPDFPGVRLGSDGDELELSGMFQALLSGEQNALYGVNARWDSKIPCSAAAGARLLAMPESTGIGRSYLTPEGLEISVPVKVRIQTGAIQEIPMITALEAGQPQPKDPSRPSVIICSGEGRSLWDLAKANGSTVEVIQSANAAQSNAAGGMLLIPVL